MYLVAEYPTSHFLLPNSSRGNPRRSLCRGGGSAIPPAFVLKTTLILFSALSFLGYGLGCFFSNYLQQEFRRYRLAAQSRLVGALQCGAAVGLIAGLWLPGWGQAAAVGLALMMAVAIGVRIRIHDRPYQMLPAIGYLLLNTYLAVAAF